MLNFGWKLAERTVLWVGSKGMPRIYSPSHSGTVPEWLGFLFHLDFGSRTMVLIEISDVGYTDHAPALG